MSPSFPLRRFAPFLGHALTVLALALAGLSSFHALRAEVVELRANLHSLAQYDRDAQRQADVIRQESERRLESLWQHLHDEIRELRVDVQDLRTSLRKGAPAS